MNLTSTSTSSIITITFITLIHFVLCNDYEIVEEEPISLNSIEKANAGFVCKSDGYFADVAYGCQFYHVCENSNNPYDKPSFVKHTFSCVNGTVFNQMSFTCTRHDDSIPCEASPNYFYLNKRNGDPKAYFLTDEDIFKPAQSLPTRQTLPLFNEENFSNTKSVARKESNYNNKLNTRDSSDDNTSTNMDSDRRSRLISSVINNYDPIDENINMGDIYSTVTDTNLAKSINHHHQTRAPYEMSPKISHYTPIVQSPPVLKYPIGAKYEPATKVNTYVPLNSHYENKPKSSNFQNDNKKLIYGSLRDTFTSEVFKPDDKSAINLSNRASLNQRAETLKNTFSTVYADAETFTRSPPIETIPTPAPTRKTTFTPATFSRLYIENQKAVKLEPIPALYTHLTKGPTLKAFDHLKQELISIPKNKTPTYTEHIASRKQDQERQVPMSKYDKLISDRFRPINQNQYVSISSPIRIIESTSDITSPVDIENNKKTHSILNVGGSGRRIEPNIQDQQPVKISFINENRNPNINHQNGNEQSHFVDYGTNYKVIKQIKGKNLLIDPSLENDPARDNIIAQVLEMLSKYN